MIMIKKLSVSLLVGILCLRTGIAGAQDSSMEENLARLLPSNMQVEAIQEAPMEGVFEVTAGNQVLYVYSVNEFLMIGDVYNTKERINLGEERKNEQISEAMKSVPEEEMIVMGSDPERYVVVFTDTDCGYCQRFHQQVTELNEKGLQVRYMMFPRAGLESDSYREAVSVWCADDQIQAMTIAKSGGRVAHAECKNPVADQYALGQKIGIRGTPTMILDTGKVIPGYLPVEQLLGEAGISVN